jgi:Holliday junction resolvase
VSTATRGRALEHKIRTDMRNAGWDVIRGASSKGEFSGMKTDLVATIKTATLNRKAGIKTGWYFQVNADGDLEVYDVAAVQAKLEKV